MNDRSRSSLLRRSLTRCVIALALLAALPLAAGCMLASAAVYQTRGPTPINPEYVPKQEPLLVLAENNSTSSSGFVADGLASAIVSDFRENKVAPIVPLTVLDGLRDKDLPAYKKMSIAEIGRATGAAQVLYVDMQSVEIENQNSGNYLRGKMVVRVRVVDSATGQTRWPGDDAAGRHLTAQTDYLHGAEANESNVYRQLDTAMATQVGHLFHEWQPEFEGPTEEQGG